MVLTWQTNERSFILKNAPGGFRLSLTAAAAAAAAVTSSSVCTRIIIYIYILWVKIIIYLDVTLHGKIRVWEYPPPITVQQGNVVVTHRTHRLFDDGQQVKLELSNWQKSRAGHKWLLLLLLLLFIVSDDDDDDDGGDGDGVVTNTDSGHSKVQWTRRWELPPRPPLR